MKQGAPLFWAAGYVILAYAWLNGAGFLLDVAVGFNFIPASDIEFFKNANIAALLVATGMFLCAGKSQQARKAEKAAARLRIVGDSAENGIAVIDNLGVVQLTNAAFRRTLDLSRQIDGVSSIETIVAPFIPDPNNWKLPEKGERQHRLQIRSLAGTESEIMLQARRINGHDSMPGWIVTINDLTANRDQMTNGTIRLRALETATDGIAVSTIEKPDAPLIYVNRAFQEITGCTEQELLGRNCRFLQGSDRQQPEIALVREAIERRRPVIVVLRNYRKDGTMYWCEIRLSPVANDSGKVTHYVAITRDVTHLRESAMQLEHLTCFDSATSLLNRPYFHVRLSEMLAGAPSSVLLVRLDIIHYNDIVECFGEEAGTRLLRDVGSRLRDEAPEGIVGLLGSDEFALAIPVADETEAERIIARVRTALGREFDLPASSLRLMFSIGTAMAAANTSATALLRSGLIALMQSKRTRIGAPRGFQISTNQDEHNRALLTSELRQAITNGDFELHYQPRVDLVTGAILGAEALIRWKHPVFGMQPPARFIAVAEQTHHIIAIGTWALREVARYAANINRERETKLSFSVNLSPSQFQDDKCIDNFRAAIEDTGADPAWLTLEITEALLADDIPETIDQLKRLRTIGFGISIDDFGTGHANLNQLAHLPVTEIKIDTAFVRGIETSRYKETVVGSIVKIGAALGLSAVAKGIECAAERQCLQAAGVSQGYGYFLSMPLTPTEFETAIASNTIPQASVERRRTRQVA